MYEASIVHIGIGYFPRIRACARVHQAGFGKEERQTLTDEEQAEKREEKHQALSAQRDKVRSTLVPLLLVLS